MEKGDRGIQEKNGSNLAILLSHISSSYRFYEGLMPDFSIQNPKKKVKRLPRFELLGANNSRVTLSVRGDTSIHTKFHNVPINLPPPPGTNSCTYEHSYARTK